MSRRYRLYPTPEQKTMLLRHCMDARYVWNLAVEQFRWWRPGRAATPTISEQSRQLTEARAEFEWLRDGSYMIQQQALRDFHHARSLFLGGTQRAPGWRKQRRNEGFRVVGYRGRHWDLRRISRRFGEVRVPKVGWVRFRWSRPPGDGIKSFRVNLDRAGRWHVSFAAIPQRVEAPGNGRVVGVDRGIVVSAALSTGARLVVPPLSGSEKRRLRLLQRRLARRNLGSRRRERVRLAAARIHARESARRRDWTEKVSTDLARRFDVIRVEALDVPGMLRAPSGVDRGRYMARKRSLNRGIRSNAWGALVRRLEFKAPGRVEKVSPINTSRRCSSCGHVAAENRKSQARFCCVACNFTANADVNAARNIAVGSTVSARGGVRFSTPRNREPQPARSS